MELTHMRISGAGDDAPGPRRFFAETGHAVSGAFLAFVEHYGVTVCGLPISDVVVEDGVSCQYFQNLALQQLADGGVRLMPLGETWYTHRQELARSERADRATLSRRLDVVATLPRHPSRAYATRHLADIHYLVIHHTGTNDDLDVSAIAQEHVGANGWPGIGYHFVVNRAGTAYRTQDLTTVSNHARQFNPVAVGIALTGDLSETIPTAAQLDAVADVLADLVAGLGLPTSAIRGHREMVPTPCPGETFLSVWKPRLVREVERRLRGGGDRVPTDLSGDPDIQAVEPEAPPPLDEVVGADDGNAPADPTGRAADPAVP